MLLVPPVVGFLQDTMNRHHLAVGGLVTLIILAGCLTASVTVSVTADGDIDEFEAELTMEDFVYDLLDENAGDAGFESVEDRFRDDVNADTAWDDFEYEETHEGDTVTITMTATGGDAAALDDIDIHVDENEVTFIDQAGFNLGEQADDEIGQELREDIEYEWAVEMPGTITGTNGDIQDDDRTVVWTLAEHGNVEEFEATSEREEPADADDELPGFGVVLGVIGILSGGALLKAIDSRAS